ncbi:unnamed protein product [Plasmodium vivax]|uniref:(malaria parasite P. vivax) hypothetical protein n=1 Tax=Plasmodium vivax TaxID=5855 RepID=A0A8S4HDN7_PLAVI|nr:unnamed protein product [Plasmodium vivax]
MYKFKTVFSDIKSIYAEDFDKDFKEYEAKCKRINPENTEIGENFVTICKKCMKYLDYLEEKFYGYNQKTAQAMLYLYSWLYDNELYKENYSKKELNIYKDLIDKYNDGSSNLPQIFIEKIDVYLIDKLKEVYDLYYKFDKFKKEKECKTSHCKCAEECYISYNTYIQNCNNPDNADFCNGLEEFRAQYNNYMSNNYKCIGDYKYLPPAINFVYPNEFMDVSPIET